MLTSYSLIVASLLPVFFISVFKGVFMRKKPINGIKRQDGAA